jgi:hypothetical protein
MGVFDRINQMYTQKGQTSPFDKKRARSAAVAAGGIGEGTKEWDALSTSDKTRRYADEGQEYVNRGTRAALDSAMPGFQDDLQGIRESAIRRGVDLGDIGTRNEGSLASAFQRNMTNVADAGARDNYNTALERLYGYRDYRTSQDNAKAERRSAGLGAVAGIAGTFLGSPAGAAVGGKIGGMMSKLGGRGGLPALPKPGARSNIFMGR